MDLVKNENSKSKMIIAVISTFVLAYYPEFMGISLIHVLAIISYIYLAFNLKKLYNIITDYRVVIVNLGLLALISYLVIVVLINGGLINDVIPVAYLLFLILPISLFIISLVEPEKGNVNDKIIKVIVYSGLLQAITAVLSYFIPEVQEAFMHQLLLAGYKEIILYLASFRMYGYSSSLTYATPALQAIIVILLFLTLKTKRWFMVVATALITFSAVINARTSIVILLIGLFIFLLFYNKNKYFNIFKYTGLTVVILGIILGIDFTIDVELSNDNLNWVISGYNEIVSFVSGNANTDYFSYVTDENVYTLPTGINLVLGEGQRIMNGSPIENFQSDIGFINDIWFGGLIYTVSLYILFSFIIFQSWKALKLSNYKHSDILIMIILVIMIALNFKGYIFSYNSVSNILFLLFYSLISSNEKVNIKQILNFPNRI